MSEVYFSLENELYLYDLETAKLYRLAGAKRLEVVNDELIRSVRFNSKEITLPSNTFNKQERSPSERIQF